MGNGGNDREKKYIFMIPVHDLNANTLIPIIKKYFLPGTRIYFEEWASYSSIPSTTFQHLTVNHSIIYANPVTGVHTQTV